MKFIKTVKYELLYWVVGLLILLILSKIWIPDGYTIAGHDSGLPLNSYDFLISRLFSWNENIGFGMSNTHLFGSITLHSIDYIASLITGTTYSGNWLNLFFWLSAIYSASIIFSYQFKNIFGRYFVFIFPPLVVFNFYIAQSLFILERAKYSVLIALLLFSAIIFRFINKNTSLLTGTILSSFVLTLFNSGSLLGVSLYGSLLIILLSIFIFYTFVGFLKRDFSVLARLLLFVILTIAFTTLLNSYQTVPYLQSIISKEYSVHLGASVDQSGNWVDYISRNTSIINLFRMQGVPNWYGDMFAASSDHPYSGVYLNSTSLMIASFILPIIVYFGYILTREIKQRQLLLLFMFITIISIFFTAGSHKPFGVIYSYIYKHLPGFYIFRNPYYKFAGGYLFGSFVLLAATVSILISKFRKNIFKIAIFIVFLGIWFSYHYVLFSGNNIFTWKKGNSTLVQVPNYVWEFDDWNRYENGLDGRILMLPSIRENVFVDSYDWGYWSLSPLTYSLPNIKGLIDEADLTSEEMEWLKYAYDSINERNDINFQKAADKLGITYVLLRKDGTNWDESDDLIKDLPSWSQVEFVKKFGEWDLYKLKNIGNEEIFSPSKLVLINPDKKYLSRTFVTDGETMSLSKEVNKEDLKDFIVEQINTYTCQSCLLEQIVTLRDLPPVSIFPDSPFYYLKERREKKEISSAPDDSSKVMTLIGIVLRKTSETKSMFVLSTEDRYVKTNAQITNGYLHEALGILEKHPELKTNYVMAKNVLDNTSPLLNVLHKFVLSEDFGRRPSSVSEYIYEEIRILDEMQDYFSPITDTYDVLRNNKTYSLLQENEVFIDTNQFSKGLDGKITLPKNIFYQAAGDEQNLEYEFVDERWIKIVLPENQPVGFNLKVKFDQPDIWSEDEERIETFLSGPRGCVVGTIPYFSQDKTYEIEVLASDKAQNLGIYANRINSDGSTMLVKVVDVAPIELSRPFRFVIHPKSENFGSEILICSEDRDYPLLEDVSIFEINAPSLEAVSKFSQDTQQSVTVSFIKHNPTSYSIGVSNMKAPYLLVFNQRYDPMWELNVNAKHFPINGYANGWLVNSESAELELEYAPQKRFLLGIVISMFGFIALTLVLILKLISSKNDD